MRVPLLSRSSSISARSRTPRRKPKVARFSSPSSSDSLVALGVARRGVNRFKALSLIDELSFRGSVQRLSLGIKAAKASRHYALYVCARQFGRTEPLVRLRYRFEQRRLVVGVHGRLQPAA